MRRLAFVLTTSVAAAWPIAAGAQVTVAVDAAANRRPINANVYGVAHAGTAELSDLNVPLNRHGGNPTTRVNWQINADNRGNDWYYESVPGSSATPGEMGDTFITNARAAGAQAMITIPTIDWVAKLGPNRSKLASFSIAKYGAQTGNDWQWYAGAGNGIRTNGQFVTGNDPNDANVPSSVAFQQGWVQHLVGRWGTNAAGGLRYYVLDNEPSIWHSTHRDVHPTGATMDEIATKTVDFATAIKNVDGSALVVGPEEWGWSGYFYSGYDQQYGAAHNWCCFPDRQSHGSWDYLPWLLDQMRQNELATGRRLLDIFSVHYYPQGGEFGNDTSTTMQLLRNRSTRALWDPAYVDPTWINDKVMLIPRLKNWVAAYYPGLPVAITEYNWGAEAHINGATTQADIYGIFGREGLDFGTRWTTPDPSTPTYKAMKLYRNYDGNRSTFGDTSVLASVPNPDSLSAYAALRSTDGALTIMVISKALSGTTPVTLSLAGFTATGVAQPWQLTAANAITRLADVGASGSSVSITVPPQSVTLLVIPAGSPNAPPVARATATPATGPAPLAVTFSGTGSTDADGSVVAYAWTFGDGAAATGPAASHTYAAAGAYAAKLTVTDNRGATSSTTIAISATASTPALEAPTGLTASTSKPGKITLRWTDRSTGEQGFYVERAANGTAAFVRVGQVGANTTSFTQTGLAPSQYTYRVQAYNATAVSAYSNQVTVKTK